MLTRGVPGLHPQGVQEGVQKSRFMRGSRGARNPMVAPCQFLPATKDSWVRLFARRPSKVIWGAFALHLLLQGTGGLLGVNI